MKRGKDRVNELTKRKNRERDKGKRKRMGKEKEMKKRRMLSKKSEGGIIQERGRGRAVRKWKREREQNDG